MLRAVRARMGGIVDWRLGIGDGGWPRRRPDAQMLRRSDAQTLRRSDAQALWQSGAQAGICQPRKLNGCGAGERAERRGRDLRATPRSTASGRSPQRLGWCPKGRNDCAPRSSLSVVMSMKKVDGQGHAMLQQPLMLLVFWPEVTLERVVSIAITWMGRDGGR
ncbi:hypothetical protein AOQ84DRAFT_378634 [Glonium stellatum]|uniref:Uncharacterized protein n=1 Tax=Glonium stellatum TaxID=574774 RepID=A0A8E2EWY5_9PEZI|nr:hypothetical protein AOQ84DRAFT_378634 [Glonium stellatum]